MSALPLEPFSEAEAAHLARIEAAEPAPESFDAKAALREALRAHHPIARLDEFDEARAAATRAMTNLADALENLDDTSSRVVAKQIRKHLADALTGLAFSPPASEPEHPVTLVEFILARIAEDEAAARAAAEDEVSGDNARHGYPFGYWDALDAGYEGIYLLGSEAVGDRDDDRTPATRHISRWDPARVLAECDAKRRIVEWAGNLWYGRQEDDLLKLLALPHADHEDYDETWRP